MGRLCHPTGCSVCLRQLPASTLCVNLLVRLFTSKFVCVNFSRRLLFAPTPRVDFVRRLVAPSFYVNFLHRLCASTCCSVFLRRPLSVSTLRADFCLRQPPRRLCAPTGCSVFLRQLPASTFYVNLLLRLFTSNFVCVNFSRRLFC